jgi:diguanylate cyclase (GGDEF)-like protein
MQSGPLSRFQGIENNEAGTWSLVRDLNRAVSSPDEESFVREDFDYWWPRLQEKMSEALAGPPEATKKNTPTDRELLLEMRRNVQQLLSHLGNRDGVDIHAAIDVLEEALRDPLTNLANRRAFSERASNLSAEDTPYVIAILDLDHFKQINDKWGHGRGDELLVLVASVINEQLSSADIVARFGGDEFDVIYQSKPPEAVIETLTEFIAALPTFAENAGFPSITASAGVSSDRIEPTELKLRDADRAMYQAKEEGRAMAKLAD